MESLEQEFMAMLRRLPTPHCDHLAQWSLSLAVRLGDRLLTPSGNYHRGGLALLVE